jgi:hypothetical protein
MALGLARFLYFGVPKLKGNPMANRKKAKKTAFVPRSLFVGAVGVGVIPICVSACGGLERSPQSSGSSVGGTTSGGFSVASGAFGVASGAFSVGSAFGVASGAFSVTTGAFGVSGSSFGGASSGTVASGAFIGGGVAAAFTDAGVGSSVADAAFGAAPPEPGLEAGGAQDATVDAPELTVAFMGFDTSAPERDAGDEG